MSQINCLPRPAFWKVPGYINNMDDNKNLYNQQHPQQQYKYPTPRKSSLTMYRDSRPHNEKIKKRVRFKDVDDNDYQQHHHNDQQHHLHHFDHSTTNNVRFFF